MAQLSAAGEALPAAVEDRPLAGIGFVVAAVFTLSLQDALAKLLGEQFAVTQILAFRGFSGVVLTVAAVLAGFATLRVRRGLRLLVGLRLLFAGMAALALYTGLRTVPLAEATVLLLTAPLFITGLAALLLRDKVGWRRWLAVLFGFAGCAVVLWPTDLQIELGALIILGAAVSWSLAAILTRRIGSGTSPLTQLFYLNLVFLLCCGAASPWAWQTPDLAGIALLLLLGVVGFVSQFAIIHGYRCAAPAVVAPFEYTALLWSALLGYLVWGEVPAPNVWAGALLIAGAGVYVAHREARMMRQARPRRPR